MVSIPSPKSISKNLLNRYGIIKQKKVYVAYSVYDKISPRVYKLMKILEACKDPLFNTNILEGDGLIDRSRSRLATDFLNNNTYDTILFLDEDIIFEPKDMVQLIRLIREKGLDIVGASYVTKNEENPKFTFKEIDVEQDFIFGKGAAVREVRYLSTGCLAISKRVFQEIVKKELVHLCHPDQYKFYPFFMPMEKEIDGKYLYLSEDWAFLERAAQCGFKSFVDCTIKLGHLGKKVFDWDDINRVKKEKKEQVTIRFPS